MRDYRTLHKGFHGKPGQSYLVLMTVEPMTVERRLQSYLHCPANNRTAEFGLWDVQVFPVTPAQRRRLETKQRRALRAMLETCGSAGKGRALKVAAAQ